jgi:hypothetical protein
VEYTFTDAVPPHAVCEESPLQVDEQEAEAPYWPKLSPHVQLRPP